MTSHFLVFLFQAFGTTEIVLFIFPILVVTGLAYRYVKKRRDASKTKTKICPHCAKEIDSSEIICPFCHRQLT